MHPDVPPELDRIICKSLEKDPDLRYQTAAELRSDLKRLKRDLESGVSARVPLPAPARSKWLWVSLAAAMVLVAAAAIGFYFSQPTKHVSQAQWQQITDYPDSAVQPSFSPDGHMLVFIRGPESFVTSGQIYLKFMPDGEPTQLTHNDWNKLAPVFQPDGSRIVYTEVQGVRWNTNEVSVTGGEPKLLLPNAAGLSWIDSQQMIFSEMRGIPHMGVVTSGPARSNQRDVYFPASDKGMAHFGVPSPDRKWVAIVEMDNFNWIRCRVVPWEGKSPGNPIGPEGGCSSAAWSPDGKWIYVTSDGGGALNHIWRVKFPGGASEQITAGPTGEAGVALSPDGKSFITSVGKAEGTVWYHDEKGDRQISAEGYAEDPMLTEDGKGLFFLQRNLSRQAAASTDRPLNELQLMRADLGTGAREQVFTLNDLINIEVSGDGRQTLYSLAGGDQRPHVWVAPTDHSSPPRQLTPSDQEDDYAHFLRNGSIVFRRREQGEHWVYSMKPDGSEVRKLIPTPIAELMSVSPAGDFVTATLKSTSDPKPPVQIYKTADGSSRNFCDFCYPLWSRDGKRLYLSFSLISRAESTSHGQTYVMPWNSAATWNMLGTVATRTEPDIAKIATLVPEGSKAEVFEPGLSPKVYAYSLRTIQRNLYRIPLP